MSKQLTKNLCTGCIFVGMFIRFNPWDEPQHYARPPGFNWVSRIYGRSPDMPCWQNNGNGRHWLLLSKEQTDEYWIQISWESVCSPIYWTGPRDGLLLQLSGKLLETSWRRIILNESIIRIQLASADARLVVRGCRALNNISRTK